MKRTRIEFDLFEDLNCIPGLEMRLLYSYHNPGHLNNFLFHGLTTALYIYTFFDNDISTQRRQTKEILRFGYFGRRTGKPLDTSFEQDYIINSQYIDK
jgi:hypothetical protein